MNKKLKVQYLIFANKNSSGGGHFYSLAAVDTVVSQFADTLITQIRFSSINVISERENSIFIKLTNRNFLFNISKLISFTKKNKPDVLHAFDHRSLFVAKVIALFYKVSILFTKCGGPNGGEFIPFANQYILFSEENYVHFLK